MLILLFSNGKGHQEYAEVNCRDGSSYIKDKISILQTLKG
jgi:hypothetical protein